MEIGEIIPSEKELELKEINGVLVTIAVTLITIIPTKLIETVAVILVLHLITNTIAIIDRFTCAFSFKLSDT